MTLKKTTSWGFPGGAVVESLPANAGNTGSSPGLGGSHVPRSSWAREPQLLSLSVWSLCSETREATIVRGPRTTMKSGPHSLQLGRALTQKQRPDTAKIKKKKTKTKTKTKQLPKSWDRSFCFWTALNVKRFFIILSKSEIIYFILFVHIFNTWKYIEYFIHIFI